jgi:hypothetical protein
VGQMKEEKEGVRFHAIPIAEMHCRDRISRRTLKGGSVHSISWVAILSSVAVAGLGQGLIGVAGGVAHSKGRRRPVARQ